jgi:Envelope integrity protein A
MRPFAATVMACALISGAAVADNSTQTSTAITGAPDATIELSGGAVAAGIGYQWGHGDVVYQGQKHRFGLSGLSIVDVGASSYTASGVVYNLHNLADLSGHYAAAGAGLTVAGGGEADYLKNEKGVVIKLLAASKGLRFNLSASGVTIDLKD